MLLDKKNHRWIAVSLVILAACLALYIPYHLASAGQPTGGSLHGIGFGVFGFALMLFAGVLGIRKRVRVWRIGRAQEWLRAHVWLGLVSFPVILLHSGLSMGSGTLTAVLMWIFLIVIISGVIGIVIQNVVPRIILDRVPHETIYEQIPEVIDQLRREADDIVEANCGSIQRDDTLVREEGSRRGRDGEHRVVAAASPSPGSEKLKSFYVKEVRPYLYPEVRGNGETLSNKNSSARFGRMRTILDVGLQDALDGLENLCIERRELDRQRALHYWLHGWQFFHIPLAYALLALSVLHAILSLYY